MSTTTATAEQVATAEKQKHKMMYDLLHRIRNARMDDDDDDDERRTKTRKVNATNLI